MELVSLIRHELLQSLDRLKVSKRLCLKDIRHWPHSKQCWIRIGSDPVYWSRELLKLEDSSQSGTKSNLFTISSCKCSCIHWDRFPHNRRHCVRQRVFAKIHASFTAFWWRVPSKKDSHPYHYSQNITCDADDKPNLTQHWVIMEAIGFYWPDTVPETRTGAGRSDQGSIYRYWSWSRYHHSVQRISNYSHGTEDIQYN